MNVPKTMRQKPTALSAAFFSRVNVEKIQRGVQAEIVKRVRVRVDRQDRTDLIVLMRAVFINNAEAFGSKDVSALNRVAIKVASDQVETGVRQYLAYLEDSSKLAVPGDRPASTTTFGKKIHG